RFKRFAQATDTMVKTLDPEHLMLRLRPCCANAELQTSTGQMVDSDGHLRQQRRMTIGVAGHHRSESNSARQRGDGCEERPAFVDRPIGALRPNRGQMVEVPDMVEA